MPLAAGTVLFHPVRSPSRIERFVVAEDWDGAASFVGVLRLHDDGATEERRAGQRRIIPKDELYLEAAGAAAALASALAEEHLADIDRLRAEATRLAALPEPAAPAGAS